VSPVQKKDGKQYVWLLCFFSSF